MNLASVWLGGPVALIPSPKALTRLGHDLPDPVSFAGQLTWLSQHGGLPARIEPRQDGSFSLAVYTDKCFARLHLTGGRDAYRIVDAFPKSLEDHGKLCQRALLIHSASDWQSLQTVKELNAQNRAPYQSYWADLAAAWHGMPTQAPPQSSIPASHSAYLQLLSQVVEATRDIEVARVQASDPWLYRRCDATREPRYSARGVYDFALVTPSRVAPGTTVYVDQQLDLKGKVVSCRGRVVTVRFESTMDFQRIPAQGALRELPSERVYKTQQSALETLATGQSKNPRLLPILVDHELTGYQASTETRSSLDKQQLQAFQRALTVPDLLLVLGPPGTGKTRTITEILTACAARGERVLLASHTNRAVDNVLERLSGQLRAVRVGNETSMTELARQYLPEVQVKELERQILAATDGMATRLADGELHAKMDRWLSFLETGRTAAGVAEQRLHALALERERSAERVSEPIQPTIAAAERELTELSTRLTALKRVADRRRELADRVGGGTGPRRLLLGWLSGPLQRRSDRATQQLAEAGTDLSRVQSTLDTARGVLAMRMADDPDLIRCEANRNTAVADRHAALSDVEQAIKQLRGLLVGLHAASANQSSDIAGTAGELRQTVTQVHVRAGILAQWRARIGQAGTELQHELVRYADVVAATCIGSGTNKLMAHLDFDVAIIDEAGQISLPNLLVPAVRARRTVLVGDHRQLPPFLDEDVRKWSTDLSGGTQISRADRDHVKDVLSKSAFELLYGGMDDAHRDMLRIQRRMPVELATFVSRTFYSGALDSDHPGTASDPVFHSPFAMITTADQSPAKRAERRGRKEEWNNHGYLNELEATLIVELMNRYADWYRDWAVIVPYRAQADLIRDRLTSALGDGLHVAERVGTVDSFQGGERDLIVFGFTRSNSAHRVGFLDELRRLNVAITRARQQLVLVGDTDTLEHATQEDFRNVMQAMVAHLRHTGDLRGSASFRAALRATSTERD